MENKKIRVAHFSFGDGYGALGAAYELHRSLLKSGIESSFFVRSKTGDDDSIIELGYCESAEERFMRLINKLYFDENKNNPGIATISFDCLGLNWNKQLEDMFKNYDIFHIHWVAGFLSIDNIYQLSRLGKPIVWTMHDFHPFTGGCHCPEKCKEYEHECSGCYALKQNPSDITKYVLIEKQHKYSEDIGVIVASNWLKAIVQNSKVFRNNTCEVIPIGIDTERFIPKNKKEMRKKIGFPYDVKVILVGAQALEQNVKGYAKFKRILQAMKSDNYCKELIKKQKLILLTFGYVGKQDKIDDEIPTVNLGFISDRDRLCEIYNVADVFVFPSIQDTFGMTAVEAMACGVPTIAFDVSAMHDVIIEGINGYKAEVDDYSSMAFYIIRILRDNPINKVSCRERIVDNYSLQCETEAILRFYHKRKEQNLIDNSEKDQKENNIGLERFISQCSLDIITGIAPNQRINMSAQEILLKYNPEFISPERKIKILVEKHIIGGNVSVYIYGAGGYGKRTLSVLKNYGVCIEGFWDMDEKKEGHMIDGYSIKKPVKKENIGETKIIIAGIECLSMIKCLIRLGYLYCQDFY
ncbi:glycosyltransferase [Lachnospiraceae bacterium 54-11]